MSSLLKRFEQPLPSWVNEIKTESRAKIRKSKLILACREDREAISIAKKTLMIRFWPFVDVFPKIVGEHKKRIIKRETWRHPFSIRQLGKHCEDIMGDIKRDEENHRKLWLDTSLVLGLTENHLYYPRSYQMDQNPQARFRVQDTIDIVGEKTDSFTALLRLASIEIIAESIGHELIIVFSDLDVIATQKTENGEQEFANLKPSRWFYVHINHGRNAVSHEEMVYRLAFALHGKVPKKKEANRIIQEVVDLFIEAGEMPY